METYNEGIVVMSGRKIHLSDVGEFKRRTSYKPRFTFEDMDIVYKDRPTLNSASNYYKSSALEVIV